MLMLKLQAIVDSCSGTSANPNMGRNKPEARIREQEIDLS